MDNWQPVSLGDIVDVKHGFAFSGEYFSDSPAGDVLLTPGNFAIGGGFQWGKRKFYHGPVPAGFVLEAGDLLVSMTDLSKGADTLGYAAVVPESAHRFLHNQRLGKVVVISDRAKKQFVHWVLRSPEYRNEVLASHTGSTVKHTSPSKIKAFKFLLPTPEEQIGIANILDAIEDKIDLNRRMNEILEAMACAIFKDWFVDFGPVRAKMEEQEPDSISTEVAALFPMNFDPEGVPLGWEGAQLDQIAEFLNGLPLQKYPPTGFNDLPVIKISELRNGVSINSGQASSNVPSPYVIQDGDILFSWSGSLTHKFWTDGPGALNQHLFKVTPLGHPKWFVYFWIAHHMPEFQAIASSKATTMGHIQRHHLSEAKVIIPSAPVMAAADAIIAPLMERTIANALENRTLASLRDLLLPKLMSGELRIRTVEKAVASAL